MLRRFTYVKICWSRAWSNLNIISTVVDKFILITLLLNSVIPKSTVRIRLIITGGIILLGVLLVLIMGHYDIKYGLYELEQTMRNEYNPEIKKIVENTEKQGEAECHL